MVEYRCEYCGRVKEAVSKSRVKRFCSPRCAALSRFREKDYDENFDWKVQSDRWICPYAENVSCETRKCGSCGWNPEVAKARTEAFMNTGKAVTV